MQPPVHIAGNSTVDWAMFVVGWFVCLYWLRALRLAREGARLFLRNLTRSFFVYGAVRLVITAVKPTMPVITAQFVAGFIALVFFGRWQSVRRSRRIPTAVRQAVIKRDLKGEAFDPTVHQIDHIWPFSKGGSHTIDNLRVIDKKKNLRKGAKRPRLREMWGTRAE